MFSPTALKSLALSSLPPRSFLTKGNAAPALYLPISSIALNINLGKGNTTVRPDFVIKSDVFLNAQKSGCLAYVTSNALCAESSSIE